LVLDYSLYKGWIDVGAFTPEEKKRFRFRKYLREKAFEFVLLFIKNVVLTEIVVWAVGSDRYITGLIMALGYSLGWVAFELINYRKEWLDIEIKGQKE